MVRSPPTLHVTRENVSFHTEETILIRVRTQEIWRGSHSSEMQRSASGFLVWLEGSRDEGQKGLEADRFGQEMGDTQRRCLADQFGLMLTG